MTNPPGAMPPLPEPWQCFQLNRGWNTWENVIPSASGEHGVVDAYTAEQMHAYAAPLIARVAELQRQNEAQRHGEAPGATQPTASAAGEREALTDAQINKCIYTGTNVLAPYIKKIARAVEAATIAALASKPPQGEHKPVGYVCPSRLADLKAGRCTAINLVSEEEAQLLDLPGHGYPDIPVYTSPHPEPVAPPPAQARMLADFPALSAFHEKHALGPMRAPSCLCCGQLPESIAIKHAELPGVIICKKCRDAALSATPPAQAVQDSELLQLAILQRDYINALPADVVSSLPAMPGFDGDWASATLDDAICAARTRGNGVEPS